MIRKMLVFLFIGLNLVLLSNRASGQVCDFDPASTILKCDEIVDLSLINTSGAANDSIKTIYIR
jgi:hypothetical protein